jgi:hypothetical protein
MAMEGTVKVPGLGPVRKKTAAFGAVGAVVLVIAIYWYRARKASTAAAASTAATSGAAGMVTDPAGNTCPALSPTTGFCPGSAEDQAALAGADATDSGYDTSALGDSGLSGYYYGSGTSAAPAAPGPGNFADNAEWAQYVEAYMTSTLDADPATVGNAIGKYLTGQAVTPAQATIIDQAIAYGNPPPVSGANGMPPGINTQAAATGTAAGADTVPDVIGQAAGAAHNAIAAAGLKPTAPKGQTANMKVSSTNPKAGTQVAAGSSVTIETSGYVTTAKK